MLFEILLAIVCSILVLNTLTMSGGRKIFVNQPPKTKRPGNKK
jgi:hypothetical protein